LVLIKALAREPGDRYADLNAFVGALENLSGSAAALPAEMSKTSSPQPEVSTLTVDARESQVVGESQPAAIPLPKTRFPIELSRNNVRWLIGGAVVLFAAWLGMPLTRAWFSPAPVVTEPATITPASNAPTVAVTQTPRPSQVSATAAPTLMPRVTPTIRPLSTQSKVTQTMESQLGFTIVDPKEVPSIAADLPTLGQMALEKYSQEARNRINSTLTFTVNLKPKDAILWRWYWCAATDKILERNMSNISLVFDADGYILPQEELATVLFENGSDPSYLGWKCLAYEIVLRDWKPGTYTLLQTTTIASDINDGKDLFEAGYMIREYTVNVTE
jgi:hypothetical protein